MTVLTPYQRARLCEGRVTMDGRPAWLTGSLRLAATVTDKQRGVSVTLSWPDAADIVSAGGRFATG